MMKIHLVSYGDERYRAQKFFLKETARSSSFFNKILLYGAADLDKSFFSQFKSILMHPRGGGYWIWKPYLVNKALSAMPVDDVLVYCDAGCMINRHGDKRFHEYIDLLMESSTGSLSFELPHKEIEYTKQEVFDYFDTTPTVINSNQLVGGIFLLKKCANAVYLVDEWYNTLFNNPVLFTDDQNIISQQKQFIKHKSDQSIFSVIRKTAGTEIIDDETYFPDFIREGWDYPFWAARLCLK